MIYSIVLTWFNLNRKFNYWPIFYPVFFRWFKLNLIWPLFCTSTSKKKSRIEFLYLNGNHFPILYTMESIECICNLVTAFMAQKTMRLIYHNHKSKWIRPTPQANVCNVCMTIQFQSNYKSNVKTNKWMCVLRREANGPTNRKSPNFKAFTLHTHTRHIRNDWNLNRRHYYF